MQPFAADFLTMLETQHNEIERLMDGLSQEALDWSPGPEINSIAVLVTHIAGAERFMFGDAIARELSNRDRPAEFETRAVDAAVLKERLAQALAYARQVLDGLTLQDLETRRTSPTTGKEDGLAWWLARAIDHNATHVGHIQLTRQLWDLRDQK